MQAHLISFLLFLLLRYQFSLLCRMIIISLSQHTTPLEKFIRFFFLQWFLPIFLLHFYHRWNMHEILKFDCFTLIRQIFIAQATCVEEEVHKRSERENYLNWWCDGNIFLFNSDLLNCLSLSPAISFYFVFGGHIPKSITIEKQILTRE